MSDPYIVIPISPRYGDEFACGLDELKQAVIALAEAFGLALGDMDSAVQAMEDVDYRLADLLEIPGAAVHLEALRKSLEERIGWRVGEGEGVTAYLDRHLADIEGEVNAGYSRVVEAGELADGLAEILGVRESDSGTDRHESHTTAALTPIQRAELLRAMFAPKESGECPAGDASPDSQGSV